MYSRAALDRRAFSALAAALVVATLAAAPAGAQPIREGESAGPGQVAIFFYPWYGTPSRDGEWEHWGEGGVAPPRLIASNFFPTRGAYSSSDAGVLRAQIADIVSAGIDTVIVSWWGPGSIEDQRLPAVIAAARSSGLGVAVHVEPYPGRTPATVAADVSRLRGLGVTDFYVYDSTSSDDRDWVAANRELAGVRVFANTSLPGKAAAGGFGGLYTYDVYGYDGSSFPRMCASAERLHLVCAPSVGPGYEAERATGDLRVRPRLAGARYDGMWQRAVRARPQVVTITSYNEWHEGTQIEPARNVGVAYESYDGAWGLRGKPAQRAYLDRTRWWVGRYRAALARTQ